MTTAPTRDVYPEERPSHRRTHSEFDGDRPHLLDSVRRGSSVLYGPRRIEEEAYALPSQRDRYDERNFERENLMLGRLREQERMDSIRAAMLNKQREAEILERTIEERYAEKEKNQRLERLVEEGLARREEEQHMRRFGGGGIRDRRYSGLY